MRILVLGGTKFVGPHVVRGLAERGHEVTVFHRGETETELPPGVRHVHGDFESFADHVASLRALAPQVVLDMRPFREEDAERVKAFKGVARRAVVISSGDVYRAFGRLWRTEPGPPDPVPLTEDSPLREKLSTAGLAYNKTAVERAVMNDTELPCTILRLPATHGPCDAQHRLFGYLKRMDDDRPAILLDEQQARWRWARGYVEDVAHAIVLAVTDERAAGRIYNVAYPSAFDEAEWIRQLARVHGWQGEVIALPGELLPESFRADAFDLTQQYEVDSSRIRSELGYQERVPFDVALRRTLEWERANPPEQTEPSKFDYAAEDAVLSRLKSRS
ncbi:MAG: NAD-dependent epimerase/dehydratase family protein [Acidobacteria bacterium]|nr:NAD-dependent epimerase/dehydratase family protein [Acidobacteriota bacterium]